MKPRAMRKRAVLLELASLGISQKRAGALLGVAHSGISRYCTDLAVEMPRESAGWEPHKARSRGRAEVMAALYRDGYTLKQIGEQFGVTRERVRQMMTKHLGITHADGGHAVKAARSAERRRAKLDDRYLREVGCTWAQYAEVRDLGKAMISAGFHHSRTPKGAFTSQRLNAGKRGIGWDLTFWQWWSIWQESGHWEQRGRGQGYVMCRRGDVGPYAVGNVFIAKATENAAEAQAGKRKDKDLPIGVKRTKSGRYVALRHINGVRYALGTHDTPELAHAAYLMAGETLARAA